MLLACSPEHYKSHAGLWIIINVAKPNIIWCFWLASVQCVYTRFFFRFLLSSPFESSHHCFQGQNSYVWPSGVPFTFHQVFLIPHCALCCPSFVLYLFICCLFGNQVLSIWGDGAWFKWIFIVHQLGRSNRSLCSCASTQHHVSIVPLVLQALMPLFTRWLVGGAIGINW